MHKNRAQQPYIRTHPGSRRNACNYEGEHRRRGKESCKRAYRRATPVQIEDRRGQLTLAAANRPRRKHPTRSDTLVNFYPSLRPRFVAGGDHNCTRARRRSRLVTTTLTFRATARFGPRPPTLTGRDTNWYTFKEILEQTNCWTPLKNKEEIDRAVYKLPLCKMLPDDADPNQIPHAYHQTQNYVKVTAPRNLQQISCSSRTTTKI